DLYLYVGNQPVLAMDPSGLLRPGLEPLGVKATPIGAAAPGAEAAVRGGASILARCGAILFTVVDLTFELQSPLNQGEDESSKWTRRVNQCEAKCNARYNEVWRRIEDLKKAPVPRNWPKGEPYTGWFRIPRSNQYPCLDEMHKDAASCLKACV